MVHCTERRMHRRGLPVFETRLAKVCEASPGYDVAITSTAMAIEAVSLLLGDYFADKINQEEFLIVTLDTKHHATGVVRITRGTLDASLVHPREVFRAAIKASASAVLLVHNHPSGDPTPSREDHAVTKRLTAAGNIVGITVLDHIVVGDNGRAVSCREVA